MAAEELVVKAMPEGFDATNQKLETTDEKFEEVSGSMEESTGLLSSLANKFGGALSAIVAGVAVATAGILSQVPILGEVVSGLTSVINAVAFQLDKRLRPVLGPVRDGLFELAQAIFEGDFGKAEEIIKDFVDAIASIDFTQLFASVTDAVDGILKKIQDAFDGQTTGGLVDQIFGQFGGFVTFAVNRVSGFIRVVIKELSGTDTDNVLAGFLVDSLGALVDFTAEATNRILAFLRGLNYGSIVNTIIGGLISVSQTITDGIVDLVNSINWSKVTSELASEFDDAIGDAVEKAIERNKRPGGAVTIGYDNLPNNGSVNAEPQSTQSGSMQNNAGSSTFLDGRELSGMLGRYGFDNITNRGGSVGL